MLKHNELLLGFLIATAIWIVVLVLQSKTDTGNTLTTLITALAALMTAAFTATLYANAHNQLIHNRRVERAYVKMSHPPPGIEPQLKSDVFKLNISIKNFGRTPARITDVVLDFLVLPDGHTLPSTPVYTRRDGGKSTKAHLVSNDDFFYFGYYQLEKGQMNEVQDLTAKLYLLGYVDYMDQFGDRHRAGYARVYGPGIDDKRSYTTDEDFAARNNLVFVSDAGYNYDRVCLPGEGNDWKESD